jgi:hypothetical protein
MGTDLKDIPKKTEILKNNETPVNNDMPSSESPYIPYIANSSDLPITTNQNTSNILKPEEPEIDMTPASVTIESKQGKSGFKTFVVIGIIIIIAVYGVVGFIYYQNKNIKGGLSGSIKHNTTIITPTPLFNPQNVSIDNGSVIYKDPVTNKKILIDKNSFPTTGITGFARVVVSPDNSSLCFESIAPSIKPALFLSDINGSNPRQVSLNKSKCLWSSNSKMIYYVGKEPGVSNVNIYSYNIENTEEENLTAGSSGLKSDFNLVGLSSDETKLICSFFDPKTENSTQCEIDLKTKNFTSL